jgi:transcriptional regulator with XRE-family HTH domain
MDNYVLEWNAMGGRADRYKDIDQHIAANVRAYREAAGLSQEELAQQMAGRGFGFSQATIWKIESGQRPVRAGELVALADCLGVIPVTDLTSQPDATFHMIRLDHAKTRAYDTYHALKEAAAAYLRAQIDLVVMAHDAHEAGVAVTELHTHWLDTLAEEAVIEARAEAEYDAVHSEQVSDDVGKVVDALRSSGYKPVWRIEDVEFHRGPLPAGAPGETADAAE